VALCPSQLIPILCSSDTLDHIRDVATPSSRTISGARLEAMLHELLAEQLVAGAEVPLIFYS
jgi:hypothetical protein